MSKRLFLLILALVSTAALLPACGSGNTAEKPSGKYEILRKTTLGNAWQMYQFRLDIESGGEFDIDLLDLGEGDRVDGYFYPEKGSGAALQIRAGNTPIYQSNPAGGVVGGAVSDRFSFTATQPRGNAYVLLFSNAGTEKTISVFVEIIYPSTASIRGPLDAK